MTIAASSGWFMKLDADGQPIGPKMPFGEGVATFSVEEPSEDDSPVIEAGWSGFRTITLEITTYDLRMAYLLFGSRRVFGWPRPLAINGREYRRRVRRR